MMIKIMSIQPYQVAAAKLVIASVAGRIFYPELSSQQFAQVLETEGELRDVEDYQQVYGDGQGLFLAVMDGDRLVGTGALKQLEGQTAELKRMWLLEDYHGQGIGYRLVRRLFKFARQAGYRRVVLQTDIEAARATAFYRRLGFVEIPPYYQTPWDGELFFGIDLDAISFDLDDAD